MDLVEVEILGQVVTSRYGTLSTGDVLRTDRAFAKHLIEECGAAKWPENAVQTSAHATAAAEKAAAEAAAVEKAAAEAAAIEKAAAEAAALEKAAADAAAAEKAAADGSVKVKKK